MYIHRIVLRDVRNFRHLDITFENEWTKEPLKSVLLLGPNGSGKTTIVQTVAALWEVFGHWLQFQFVSKIHELPLILRNASYAAVEIVELYEKPIWVYVALDHKLAEEVIRQTAPDGIWIGNHNGTWEVTPNKFDPSWARSLHFRREQLQAGASDVRSLSNIVFLTANRRFIERPQVDYAATAYAESPYQWLVTYQAHESWHGHIESMLRNLKLRSPDAFYEIVERLNHFLVNKKLTDFDRNLRLIVETPTSSHAIDELSAGEQQCLIMMFMVSRWLSPGGIALIDEPDLHLHVSLQRHFIHELEKVVHERNGQLIVTSHSPTMWEEFSERQSILLERELYDELG